jgi:hypothetical protein
MRHIIDAVMNGRKLETAPVKKEAIKKDSKEDNDSTPKKSIKEKR